MPSRRRRNSNFVSEKEGGITSIFRALLNEIQNGRDVSLVTVVGGEIEAATGCQMLYDGNGNLLRANQQLTFCLPHFHRQKPGVKMVELQGKQIEVMVELFSPQPTLLILGSGHIAECLVSLGKLISYQVIVADDRPEFANRNKLPSADHIICGSFDEIMGQIPLHSQCYAVLATRGHQTDAICLSHLLDEPIPYIGMVGSKRKIRSIFSLLSARDLSLGEQKNLYAPAGLDIDSETPQEIALSILAEIQLIRFGGTGRPLSSLEKIEKIHSYDDRRCRHDLALLETIARAEEESRTFAAVTILETKGHVPRGAGNRMIVWEDGTIYSTIGGGRRENEIIQMALQSLKEGRSCRSEADFAGNFDSFQPVCGGRFTFFIQPYVPSTFPTAEE